MKIETHILFLLTSKIIIDNIFVLSITQEIMSDDIMLINHDLQ